MRWRRRARLQSRQWAPNSGENSEIRVDFRPKFVILATEKAKNGHFAQILHFAGVSEIDLTRD